VAIQPSLRERFQASSTRFKRALFVWGSLAPILLFFLVFSAIPILSSAWISLHEWPLLGKERPFIFISNYVNIFQDPRFWISLKNTVYYALAYMVLVISLGLLFAILINGSGQLVRDIFRPIYFSPQVTSAVAVAVMFKWLYQPQWGVLNYVLGLIGLGPFQYLQSPTQVMPSIIATGVWRAVGYSMVIYTAGLMAIPIDLHEAAYIDGASRWQDFWRITLPLLKPTTLFMFVTSMIGGFRVFTEVWLMSGGGPGTASRVLVLEIYDQGFRYFQMGRASALAFVLFFIIAFIAFLQMRYMGSSYTD
jgi:multiple sugar transport system permease protein